MSINWISVNIRLPDDRRKVLVWGSTYLMGTRLGPEGGSFLGSSRYNLKRDGTGVFDCESFGYFGSDSVTHWAEIEGPGSSGDLPPPKRP